MSICWYVYLAGGTCNAYGSVSGCLVGESCASPADCIRTAGEFHGYQPPPAKAVTSTPHTRAQSWLGRLDRERMSRLPLSDWLKRRLCSCACVHLQVILFVFLALVLMSAFVCCLWCCFSVWDKRRMAALKARIDARRNAASGRSADGDDDRRQLQLSSLPVSASFRSGGGGASTSASSRDVAVSSSIPRATVTVTSVKKKREGTGGASELQESLLEGKSADDSSGDGDAPAVGGGRRYAVRLNDEGVAEVALLSSAATSSPTSSYLARAAATPLPFPPPLPPLSRTQSLVRNAAKLGLVMSLLATAVMLIVACLLFPHVPQYSLCNKDIQWGSILTNLKDFQVRVDVDLHVAVWNSNRFHVNIQQLGARILYGQDIVGVGGVRDVGFSAGMINDFILPVAFAPSVVAATSMLRDHLRGQLLLDVVFDIETSVLLDQLARPLLRLNTSHVFEDIDAEGPEERQYCKCKDPNVNAMQPRIGIRVQQQSQDVMRKRVNLLARIAPSPDPSAVQAMQLLGPNIDLPPTAATPLAGEPLAEEPGSAELQTTTPAHK